METRFDCKDGWHAGSLTSRAQLHTHSSFGLVLFSQFPEFCSQMVLPHQPIRDPALVTRESTPRDGISLRVNIHLIQSPQLYQLELLSVAEKTTRLAKPS
jgi:hypothetical protein